VSAVTFEPATSEIVDLRDEASERSRTRSWARH